MAIQHQQTSFLSVGHEIGCVFAEITYERLSIMERVAEHVMDGDCRIHATPAHIIQRIGLAASISQPCAHSAVSSYSWR